MEKWNGKTRFQLTTWRTTRWKCTIWPPSNRTEWPAQGGYDAWFNDVTAARNYAVPSRIFLGAAEENPVLLTRQDWRGRGASWGPKGIGYWEVNVVAPTRYDVAAVRPAESGRRRDVFLRQSFRAAIR